MVWLGSRGVSPAARVDEFRVAVLDEHAPWDGSVLELALACGGAFADGEQADVLPAIGERLGGVLVEFRGDDDLEEPVGGGDKGGGFGVDGLIDREDAAVRGERVARDGEFDGVGGCVGDREAAGVGVLDNRGSDAGFIDAAEGFDEFEGGGGVEDVVVAEVFSGELLGVDDGGAV